MTRPVVVATYSHTSFGQSDVLALLQMRFRHTIAGPRLKDSGRKTQDLWAARLSEILIQRAHTEVVSIQDAERKREDGGISVMRPGALVETAHHHHMRQLSVKFVTINHSTFLNRLGADVSRLGTRGKVCMR